MFFGAPFSDIIGAPVVPLAAALLLLLLRARQKYNPIKPSTAKTTGTAIAACNPESHDTLLHLADSDRTPAGVVLAALAAVVEDCDEEAEVPSPSVVPAEEMIVDVDKVVGIREVVSAECVAAEVATAVADVFAVLLVSVGCVAAGCVVAGSVAASVVGVGAGYVGVWPSDIALAIDSMMLLKADALGPVLTVMPVKPPVGPAGFGPAMAGIGEDFSWA